MGKYGVDKGGYPYVHVRAWKQSRLIVEFIQTEGVVRIRCRKCFRWHKITIRGRVPIQVKPENLPSSLQLD